MAPLAKSRPGSARTLGTREILFVSKIAGGRARNVTAEEIDRRLQSAGDHLGAMMKHERVASDGAAEAARTKNFDVLNEAGRLFARDFEAFVAAARTAWNYLTQVADVAGSRGWLEQRLDSDLCRFHRALANQDTHDHGVIFGVRQRINVEGTLPIPLIHTSSGPLPRKGTFKMDLTVTDFVDMAYQYNPKHLEPDVGELCERVLRQHSNGTVIELGARYLGELRQVFKSGQRRGRFEVVGTISQ
jgi:hypothetical protein